MQLFVREGPILASLVHFSPSQQYFSTGETCDYSRPSWRAAGSQRVVKRADSVGCLIADAMISMRGIDKATMVIFQACS